MLGQSFPRSSFTIKMLRAVCSRLGSTVFTAAKQTSRKTVPAVTSVRHFGVKEYSDFDEKFDQSLLDCVNNKDIDGWTLRGVLSDYHGYDVIPDPPFVEAVLRACRRVDDIGLAIRFMEAAKFKCRAHKTVWPWLMQEVKPTMEELGIPTLEQLGYDKPELYVTDVHDM